MFVVFMKFLFYIFYVFFFITITFYLLVWIYLSILELKQKENKKYLLKLYIFVYIVMLSKCSHLLISLVPNLY